MSLSCVKAGNLDRTVQCFLPGALKVFMFGTEAALLFFLMMLFFMCVNRDLGGSGGGGGGGAGFALTSV